MGPLSINFETPFPNQQKMYLEQAEPMTEPITFGQLTELAENFEPTDVEDDEAREDRQWSQMAEDANKVSNKKDRPFTPSSKV